ncbi:MAG: transposase [Bradyrhizobium sp.]
MRRSLHTEHEILVLLGEAESGVPIAEICSTAGVSLRTFYRWRQRYGGLSSPALRHLRELEIENQRLRSLVTKFVERQPNTPASAKPAPRPLRQDCGSTPHGGAGAPGQGRGAVIGRYASVRYGR